MKTNYSILYITLNAALNERISIGIIMSNGSQYLFKYSIKKLSLVKNFLDSEKYYIVTAYLKSIEKDSSLTLEFNDHANTERRKKIDWMNESYINYLSKYSNNIIQFSVPKIIDIDLNELNFKWLYEKYIFKTPIKIVKEKLRISKTIESYEVDSKVKDYLFPKNIETIKQPTVYSRVKDDLFPKIAKRVNLERLLTSKDFENLFTSITIDFIGMNGVPVAGQVIDFEKEHIDLENDITRFVSLTKAVELHCNRNIEGKYYILGKEPNKNTTQNHQLWKHIKDSDFLDFVDIDEVDIVEKYIESHDVKPFFSG